MRYTIENKFMYGTSLMSLSGREPVFSVATPSYNRGHVLQRVYDSLCAQSFTAFEWIIIDDGSTDNTGALVRAWAAQAPFEIRYYYQENQHKKVAINYAVAEARGRFIVIADSDDEILPDALQHLHDAWERIPEEQKDMFVGVTGLCIEETGQIVGNLFPEDPWDVDSLTCRYVAGIRGEKWGCQRLDVMRAFPFPDFVAGLVPESYVWDQIALHYKTRYVNRPLRLYHDSADSITRGQRAGILTTEADGILFSYRAFCDETAPSILFTAPQVVLKAAVQYQRYALHQYASGRAVRWLPQRRSSYLLLLITAPISFFLWARDRIRFRSSQF